MEFSAGKAFTDQIGGKVIIQHKDMYRGLVQSGIKHNAAGNASSKTGSNENGCSEKQRK